MRKKPSFFLKTRFLKSALHVLSKHNSSENQFGLMKKSPLRIKIGARNRIFLKNLVSQKRIALSFLMSRRGQKMSNGTLFLNCHKTFTEAGSQSRNLRRLLHNLQERTNPKFS